MYKYYNIFTNECLIDCPKVGILPEGTTVENLNDATPETKRACGIYIIVMDNSFIPENCYEDVSKRLVKIELEGVYIERVWVNSQYKIPNKISATGIRYLLYEHNLSDKQIYEAIDNLTEDTIKDLAKIEWEYGVTIDRNSIIIFIINQFLGLTFDQINNGFIKYKN